jgi:large subunit ribosomal protein L3
MLNGLLGKKVGMTQFFTESGERVPVTVLQTGPVTVIQKKTQEKDGYQAIQLGYEEFPKSKEKNINKPTSGHFKDQKVTRYLREFKVDNIDEFEIGQTFDVSLFEKGEIVDVSGTSKGRGFSGVMKRHNFAGGPASHGHRFNRGTGSIGQSASPAKIFKNKKMSGQYGNASVTVQGIEIVEINKDLNVLLVKGAVPGPNGRFIEVRRTTKGK